MTRQPGQLCGSKKKNFRGSNENWRTGSTRGGFSNVSGNPSPTKFDSIIAAKLSQAAEAVRMKMRDHIILGDGSYFSFAENKKL